MPSWSSPTTFRSPPGSSHRRRPGDEEVSFRPEIEVNDTKTRVMVDQLTVIDPQTRLGEFAGRLCSSEMRAADHALQVVLALDLNGRLASLK